ncbi:PBECR4 domain-containing protein [Lactobacillus gasseri]|uniref:PBECR4 domain-containing protein n=1 Tax=Limosilactobacillus vaginalis TaxID=1633 RepID=A0ABT4K814_9LACO|nr:MULTISPECIES: PBECR4 domain-containing protein [Lactobacillaceae]MCT7749870.1 PBECR4 domain-containing protein [Lactobacillus gasseri]MCZ3760047.1 PBECR4 domain-containing protein [Lactobacillus gasseri]MCZ3761761.1 PBECR4 domain-containing protein [Lactobacillus gasseri]MCZ3765459.1 PBECR4 domain-containing protein [Lactobacillus gasseri]MCZ3767016.1 PBECR4 domain-containing protein [Lactobacillus gasseri]
MNNNYFNYIQPTKWIKLRRTDKLADANNIKSLNKYSDIIHNSAKFYKDNLEGKQIDYVYKEKNEVKILPVIFKKENFSHLTGINFGFSNAENKFETLLNGNNTTPLIIETGKITFRKLKALKKLPDILKPTSTTLTNLKAVKQAQSIGFSKGIKNEDNDLLLALHNFKPEFYQPRSLLNIKNSNEYSNVPANTILGIFQESNDQVTYLDENNKERKIVVGRGAGAIALNHEYIKTPQDALSLASVLNKSISAYATKEKKRTINIENIDDLGRQLNHEKAVPNRKRAAKTVALRKRFGQERE